MTTEVTNNEHKQERFTERDPDLGRIPLMSSAFRWCRRLIVLGVVAYAGIILFLMANETSLVYPGSKYPRGEWKPDHFEFEEVCFESKDGTQLCGWFLPANKAETSNETDEQKKSDQVVLLCHGNAENVAQASQSNGDYFRHYLEADVFVFDYRGYGKSEGVPDEPGVLADAEAALEFICEKESCDCSDVILVGHSIGGGPAVHLAEKFGCKALILQRTFNELTAPAQNIYPWIPVSLIMRNQYPSKEKIKNYEGPLFQSHGDSDKLIPIEFAKELFECAPTENKIFFEVPGMTHWDPLPQNYWDQVAEFVEALDR